MNVVLPPGLAAIVEKHVRSGAFRTPEEVVTAALLRAEEQDAFDAQSAAESGATFPGMSEKIAEGLEDIRAGRVTDGDIVFDELEREDNPATQAGRKIA